MSALVLLSTATDSGPSNTDWLRVASKRSRTCGASFGIIGLLRVGAVDAVHDAPQHVALERQGGHGAGLLLGRPAVPGDDLQRVFGVAGRLVQPCPEVREAVAVDP